MAYIDKRLMSEEKIIYRTKLHWVVFGKPFILFLFSLFLISIGMSSQNVIFGVFGTYLFIFTFIYGIGILIKFVCSEFIISNKRVLIELGFIKRISLETILLKVEGVEVYQGMVGRILNYGTVIISGTGGTIKPFYRINNPMEFRNQVLEQINGVDRNDK